MTNPDLKSLPIAVRVYPQPKDAEPDSPSRKPWKCPKAMLVFDTETRTDATQSLTFGGYRLIIAGECLEEGLFYADDLLAKEQGILKDYVATRRADTAAGGVRKLRLLTLREFTHKIYQVVYSGRGLLVGFNLPFDFSRIADDSTDARGRFAGGFSLGIWTYLDKTNNYRRSRYRPRIGIKHIDSKRALKGFTARSKTGQTDLIPEDSANGEPQEKYKFRGHFLDLRTLAYALTDKGYSLASACQAFGVEDGKQPSAVHGTVTEEYIDYNRRDVLATSELAAKLLEEYDKHPITLQATQAFSSASIGKAYLRAMGIKPVLERQPDFPKKYLGYAESAFFGGRTSAHIRKVPIPIVYTDFLSMYPTVNSLMDLWRFVTAAEIKVVENCQAEMKTFLSQVTAASLFNPATWKQLTGFVKIIPNGDILPTRSRYSLESNDWQVAVNHPYAKSDDPNDALWFSLADVVVSRLLTGRTPEIVDAFRIEPLGQLPNLVPTKLYGSIQIDPGTQDFFKIVVEERKRLSARPDLSEIEKKRLDKSLKVLANGASYGIYAQMNREESDHKVTVQCYGIDADPFTCRVAHPDAPGEYCFSPFASLITGAARLMLALLEHCVTELDGAYAMEDTDSMAIVATKRGGIVPCPGGSRRFSNGRDAVRALSWQQVKKISERFSDLNPYERNAVPGSILKIEDDNYDDPKTRKHQRQVYCFAISAKRYALFLKDEMGVPFLLRNGENNKDDRWSEHGLGHLLNPTDPDDEDRDWIAQVWLNMVRRALGLQTQGLSFEHLPAVGRVSISSPAVMRSLDEFNAGKKYRDQVKPFNFLLTCYVRQFGHPIGTDPECFHLIAPYDSDPRDWLKNLWIDKYSKKRYRISATGHHGDRRTARVKTYGDVLREYEFHPESKCADANGEVCGKRRISPRIEMCRCQRRSLWKADHRPVAAAACQNRSNQVHR